MNAKIAVTMAPNESFVVKMVTLKQFVSRKRPNPERRSSLYSFMERLKHFAKSTKSMLMMKLHKISKSMGVTSFITCTLWQSLGKPHLQSSDLQFESASKHQLPILGKVELPVKDPTTCCKIWFHVTSVPGLNLIGRSGIRLLDLSVDEKIKKSPKSTVAKVFEHLKPDTDLQQR